MRDGYEFPFRSHLRMSREIKSLAKTLPFVYTLLEKEAVEEVTQHRRTHSFFGHLFLVLKSGGSKRQILDLKALNEIYDGDDSFNLHSNRIGKVGLIATHGSTSTLKLSISVSRPTIRFEKQPSIIQQTANQWSVIYGRNNTHPLKWMIGYCATMP